MTPWICRWLAVVICKLGEKESSRGDSVRPLSLFNSGASADEVEEIARSALSLARSAQAERDNESCFFVRAAGVHRFIRRTRVPKLVKNDKVSTYCYPTAEAQSLPIFDLALGALHGAGAGRAVLVTIGTNTIRTIRAAG
ncbi:hypothetical protein EVAR_65587_1 [Eumeta japonica]|uniref:Uncharacterized protein n=1 Tax=Eumeta variegata TaxID=151549 RepID=A0A4C1YZT2_EUMVA|nr:hypothetical protein EVAR_65587_1 [Eumeta japonica]